MAVFPMVKGVPSGAVNNPSIPTNGHWTEKLTTKTVTIDPTKDYLIVADLWNGNLYSAYFVPKGATSATMIHDDLSNNISISVSVTTMTVVCNVSGTYNLSVTVVQLN